MVSKTTPTLQVVENPKLRQPSPFHDSSFKALKELGADYVRYVPWFPYPKLAVAELKPPARDKTFWDFTYPDSTMQAFMEATNGHSVVINFSKSYLTGALPHVWLFALGALFILVTLFLPKGLIGSLASWRFKPRAITEAASVTNAAS